MSKLERRDFLKAATASLAVPALLKSETLGAANRPFREPAGAPLPDIPTSDSLQSVVMTHKFGDHFNPPGLTNQWGCAQAAMDVAAVRSIAFPPFAQGEMNVAPLGAVC